MQKGLLDLPNEILLYIFRNFLDLPDIWSLLQTSTELRLFAATIIRTTWKIDTTSNNLKMQCRAALIALETLSTQLSFQQDKKSQVHIDKNGFCNSIVKFLTHGKSDGDHLLMREERLHKNMICGISSYQHQFVLIEDIDLRNRIRTTVDLIFHHAVFVSAGRTNRAFSALMVRLLVKMDTWFSCYCREITYTLADNMKAFLEFTGYKLLAPRPSTMTLHSISACFDLMGAAFIAKLLSESHIDCAVQRTCELLDNNNKTLVAFKRDLLTNLLDHWIRQSSELHRYIRMEIEKCNLYI